MAKQPVVEIDPDDYCAIRDLLCSMKVLDIAALSDLECTTIYIVEGARWYESRA